MAGRVRRRWIVDGVALNLGSPARVKSILHLIMSATNGEFAIVHQDNCSLNSSLRNRCSCVPSVWRVERGLA